jgi:uncharacterized coiled-coil protein SlyX
MKKKSTSQLRHQIASTRRMSVSALFNLRSSIGLLVFLSGVFLALLSFGPFSSVLAQNGTTREQMTLALAQALAIQPPACVPGQEMFNDVPASSPFCPFIEELVRRGITTGCGGGNYCPSAPVSRAQMAAFLIKVLESHSDANDNTATGIGTLQNNTTGNLNTATGAYALNRNTAGQSNTASGVNALFSNTSGSANIGLGSDAGSSLTTGSNNIDIGNLGAAGESNTIRIGVQGVQGATFIAGIRGVTTGLNNAVPVLIDGNGQLGTTSSSRRFKNEIKPMEHASEAILALKPVTFHYKGDSAGTPQFGLIAEEVAEVNPDLVVRDADGEIYTVRYEAVNAMLLNEFLKEHRTVEELKSAAAKQEATIAQQDRKIQELEATITQLQKGMESVIARLKEQDSTIQKVSDQIELKKSVPQVVANAP